MGRAHRCKGTGKELRSCPPWLRKPPFTTYYLTNYNLSELGSSWRYQRISKYSSVKEKEIPLLPQAGEPQKLWSRRCIMPEIFRTAPSEVEEPLWCCPSAKVSDPPLLPINSTLRPTPGGMCPERRGWLVGWRGGAGLARPHKACRKIPYPSAAARRAVKSQPVLAQWSCSQQQHTGV